MKINPHLHFNGNCEAAFKFYEKVLNGKIETMMTYAGSPIEAQVPPEWRDKILHATLMAGEAVLMGADAPPDRYVVPKGFTVALHVTEPSEAETIFHNLAENGSIQMPIQQTFWTLRFGMCTDQFGTPWMVNCTPAE